jgi:hypothetical protein
VRPPRGSSGGGSGVGVGVAVCSACAVLRVAASSPPKSDEMPEATPAMARSAMAAAVSRRRA